MNIFEWKQKLHGRPYRAGDGGSDGGGGSDGMSDATREALKSYQDANNVSNTTVTASEVSDANAAASGSSWTQDTSSWDNDAYDAANDFAGFATAGWGSEDPLGTPDSPSGVVTPSPTETVESKEEKSEDAPSNETVAQSIAKGLLGNLQTNPPTSNPYGVDGKANDLGDALKNFADSVKSAWNNKVSPDARFLSSGVIDPAQAAQMRAMGVEPPTISAQQFVDKYSSPSALPSANGGISQPGYSVGGIAIKDQRALEQSGFGNFDDGPNKGQTISQARGVQDVFGPAAETVVKGLEMFTPLGTVKNIVQGITKAQKTGDWAGTAMDMVGGWATQKAIGMANTAILKELGPVGGLIGDINRGAALGRMVGLDTKGINPAGMIASAFGATGSASTSTTLPDGSTPFVPSWTGGGGGGRSAPEAGIAPIQTTSTTQSDAAIDYGKRTDGAALGRAISEGAATRYRR